MPVAYFRCTCQNEHREIVPFDHSRDNYNERTRRWEFDPSKPSVKVPATIACPACGQQVTESPDPKAVSSFVKINWME